ncbi:MAG: helix-turn-helix transcriptional regulator [Planctomycetota bacterium]
MFRRLQLRDLLRTYEVCHYTTVTSTLADEPHTHDFVEVYWVIAGRGRELLDEAAQRIARATPVALTPGSAAFVRHDDTHAFANDHGLSFRNLAMPRRHWASVAKRYPRLGERMGRRVSLGVDGLRHVEAAAADLRAGRRDALAADKVLLALDAAIIDEPVAMPDWLRQATEADLVEGGVEALVDAAGRSAAHVSRACRRYLDQSPTDVVNHRRLTHAARLLERTGRDVTQVMLASGFANAGHFHKLFRTRFGTTPLRYRRRQQVIA